MFIQLEPGTDSAPVAKEDWTIPVDVDDARRQPGRDPLLARRRHARLPAAADLRRRPGPRRAAAATCATCSGASSRRTATSRAVNGAVAERRTNLRRLITSLNQLNGELASHDDDLAGLVDSSSAVLRSFASEEQNISAAVSELPEHAAADDRPRSARSQRFADVLGPTTERLRPAARALDPANKAVEPFAKEATPLLRNDIRPFVREARPLVRDLRPAAIQLADAAPGLTRTFTQLNHFFNLLAYNPNGREGPENAGAPGGLPVLARLGAAHGDPAVLELRRQRRVPPGHDRRALRDDRATPSRTSRELEFLAMLTPLLTDSQGLRDEVAMHKAAPSLPGSSSMVVFALSCFGLLLFLWLSFGGPVPLKPKGYRVQVAFPEATTLATEADVRVAGVSVGKVRKVEVGDGTNRTVATIELERRYAPLRTDARAILRQKTLLGETYVELTPGTPHEDDPRGRAAAERAGQADRRARRDLRLAGPGHARGVPGLAAGAGQGHQGPRARLQRRARHAARLRRRRRRRARRARHPGGRGAAPGQEHRRGVRRADRERGAAAQPDHGLQARRSTRPRPRTTRWPRRSAIFPTFLRRVQGARSRACRRSRRTPTR